VVALAGPRVRGGRDDAGARCGAGALASVAAACGGVSGRVRFLAGTGRRTHAGGRPAVSGGVGVGLAGVCRPRVGVAVGRRRHGAGRALAVVRAAHAARPSGAARAGAVRDRSGEPCDAGCGGWLPVDGGRAGARRLGRRSGRALGRVRGHSRPAGLRAFSGGVVSRDPRLLEAVDRTDGVVPRVRGPGGAGRPRPGPHGGGGALMMAPHGGPGASSGAAAASVPRIVPPPPSEASAVREALAKDINGPLFVADLLLARGIRDKESARAFFLPEPAPAMDEAGALRGIGQAVALLTGARARGERVAVHGDYDVDGVTGTAVLYLGLRALGFDADWILPNRFDGGYGMTPRTLDQIKERGAAWVVTVDTGVSAVAETEYARSLGLRVIITDHHQAPPVLPAAEVILNPNQPGCPYPNKGLSGCGVAWRLLEALAESLRREPARPGVPPAPYVDASMYLDLVALGSLADNVPLNGENRGLVRAGLRRMASSRNVGLRVLLERTGVDAASFTTSDILFRVTPLLNASGRMGSPETSVKLFLAADEREAHRHVDKMEAANGKRRTLDQANTADALAMVERAHREDASLVVHSREWHEGVIGIVAARLV